MKRFLLVIITFFLLSATADAAHIKGGFFTYEYLGPGAPGNLRYKITLTVYMVCNANAGQVSDPITFSIFNRANLLIANPTVSKTNEYQLGKTYDEPCISGDQRICYYKIVVYQLSSIELPATPDGYLISYQRCCRIAGIINVSGSGNVGNTFTATIPGTTVAPGAETNSSPSFLVNDTAVVCRNSFFQYSFQANDIDGDSLSYSFCDAYTGGTTGGPSPNPAANPPYSTIPYVSPYSGTQPMGSGVTINPINGIISGNAPDVQGTFVICVCVNEYRNGVLINTTRKELHVDVSDCDPLNAQLAPRPTTCDGFTVNFSNDVGNPAGTIFKWTFGEPSAGSADTSFLETPSHTYALAGTYNVRLRVSLAGLCVDSTDLVMNVFPGFFPGFTATGSCFTNPILFTDTTKTLYGVVNSWSWDFGDPGTLADTSHLQNPQWTYSSSGIKTVTLRVTNSKGCTNTVTYDLNVLAKPVISLAFKDTLICRNDVIQLNASGTGVFSWTPLASIISNANTGTPIVSPLTTTFYQVNLNDNGCINQDSVQVRVVNGVTLNAMADTTICQGDSVQLNATSDGLTYSWTPAANLSNPTIVNPIAITNATTTYKVVARVGSCSASDSVVVKTIPYPIANAGADPTVCFNGSAQLNAAVNGNRFTWTPTSYLSNPNILNPVSSPPRSTQYILSAYDILGCPKPGRDTIIVTVLPRVRAYAGRDTSVTIGQPLLFNGSGGINYSWSPPIGLSNPTIYNPIGIYNGNIDSIKYKLVVTDIAGCADSSFIIVRIFRTSPYVFVPTAFTPNNDGKNDVIRPISVGIQKLNYFSIFNRWGQLVFTTTIDRAGWDGRINGKPQDSGVFVWMVSAVDYTGAPIFLKGTVALIR